LVIVFILVPRNTEAVRKVQPILSLMCSTLSWYLSPSASSDPMFMALIATAGDSTSSGTSTLSSPAVTAPIDAGSPSTMAHAVPMSHALYSITIKSLVPYTLDLESHNYSKWCTLFTMVLGRFNLLPHILEDDNHSSDFEWTKEDLLVGNGLYSTLSDNLMDMCLQLHKPTAREIWVHLENLFTGNKPSRAVHMECELHNFVQGDLSANAYCHCLQQLANSLTDCDAPIQDRALVHQLIRGLNPKFSVIKTASSAPPPPPPPKFPTFIEAHELILSEEASRNAESKRTSKAALLAAANQPPNLMLLRWLQPPPSAPTKTIATTTTTTAMTTSTTIMAVVVMDMAAAMAVAAATPMLHSGLPFGTGASRGVLHSGMHHGPVPPVPVFWV
jgi:hypothetical protein